MIFLRFWSVECWSQCVAVNGICNLQFDVQAYVNNINMTPSHSHTLTRLPRRLPFHDFWMRHRRWCSGAARGKLPPYGWTSKNYVIYACFHCHGTSSYHTTNTLQGRRAKSHVDTQTIQPDWGTSYSRPPIDPYLTSPLLQNPGGAIAWN